MALLLLLGASAARADADFPNKPVRIIVPYAAGGGYDMLLRALAPRLSDIWKQPVVVDNKPGANEIVAVQAGISAPPDGYTLLVVSGNSLVNNPLLYSKLPYDVDRDLALITRLVEGDMVYVVRTSLDVKSLDEFIEYARKSGKANYGSSGNGGTVHIAMAWIGASANVPLTHLPYKGSAPIITDMMAGIVDSTVAPPNLLVPFVKSGQLRAIAVSGSQRMRSLPDVPTVYESGHDKLGMNFFNGLAAPAKTPPAVLAKIADDVHRVMCSESFKAQNVVPFDYVSVCDSPEQFRQFVAEDTVRRRRQIEATGIRLE